MADNDLDLLAIDRGLVVAPAGCGKTQLIANALARNDQAKPVLVLTHTNAGVAALRSRLDKAGVKPAKYRLATIDGWAIRLISTFPQRAGHDPAIIESQRPNYQKIRDAAWNLLKAGHINEVIEASYSRLLVDEYQDCSIRQHAIVYYAAAVLPTCVVGDPVQAIFGFGDDELADWDEHVCKHFKLAGELDKPWRWVNADAEELGQWLREIRKKLIAREAIDLGTAPAAVTRVMLDGTASDHTRLLEAGRIAPPGGVGSVLIIGESTSPASQQKFASQTPGAVTVESVDLRDLVSFARDLDINGANALGQIAEFAAKVMTNVGAADLVRRVDTLTHRTARKEPTDAESAALAFQKERSYRRVSDLLVEINKETGVRTYRQAVLRACHRALQVCSGPEGITFQDAAVRIREQNRLQGRALPRRAVGSTLLLKGLEAEVSVVLGADDLNARNLYVAMTRGSKRLVICARNTELHPSW
jgi:DNA helicase-2/ATP-dependent DNA helicase PcrA